MTILRNAVSLWMALSGVSNKIVAVHANDGICGPRSNLGFEEGNLACWDTSFTTSGSQAVSSWNPDFVPQYGNYMAVVSGGGLTNTISRKFTSTELAAIVGKAAWNGNDYLPYNDSGLVRVVSSLDSTILFQASIAQYGDTVNSPWMPFTYTPPSGIEEFTLEILSKNAFDCFYSSYVLVDLQGVTVNPGGPYVVLAGTEADIQGTVSSDGTVGSSTWSIECGGEETNYSLEVASIDETSGSLAGTVSFAPLTEPQLCTLTLTAHDFDNNPLVAASTKVIVVDPSAGFVTGGGWFTSPMGAYTINDYLVGPATFGFVSKYKKGHSTPTGETSFEFEMANFVFESTSYEWLVITGADCAKYKGLGLINEDSSVEYGFMLTACDNGEGHDAAADTFRIKIWEAAGDTNIVYDNMIDEDDNSYAGTDIGGGNIQVHQQVNKKNLRA